MDNLKTCVDISDTDCPICYDHLSSAARTLSCSHTFCHDCLVRTLVSINKDGVITRDNIVCPICRHLTFITKQNDTTLPRPPHADHTPKTLEVPLLGTHLSRSPHVPPLSSTGRFGCITQWLSGVSGWLHPQNWISPRKKPSEIFIISELGRPMKEDDLDVLPTVVIPSSTRRRRTHPKICTTGRCLLFLLTIFSLLALITVTLPWVLLA